MLATRPRTLPACVGPVLVGNALAYANESFSWLPMSVTLICALMLQVSVNLANDYFDFVNGVDTHDRLGPVRVTQSGLLPPVAVRNGMIIALALASSSGLYLVWLGGWPLLVAGLLAVLTILAYSGGPLPLASNALGDVAVFVFYGPVAVAGTYYVQSGTVEPLAFALSIAVSLPIVAVLVVNNLRDIPTDARAGKITSAVRLGAAGTRRAFAALIAIPFLIVLAIPLLLGDAPRLLWLALIVAPGGWSLVTRLYQTTGAELNPVLAHTAAYSLLFCVLVSAGVLIG
ncbi:MAG: 1,4-dihydroxy-2-naphthoate polyprenyltransferase [Chromatiales bacterium]|nr:MAG: 1,4-dihydroxy-2-naphthoate polyprenyltransferase [Chromatiales bacterium]